MITGKDLVEMGFKPGKWFGEALQHINSHELTTSEVKAYMVEITPKQIDPFTKGKAYFKNIKAESEDEVSNVANVFETMDELMKTPTLIGGAVMPDACPTGKVGQIPVGGIAVAHNAIHPAMHSADVCCSVMLTNYGQVDPKLILDTAQSITHFGGGGRSDLFDMPDGLMKMIKDNPLLNTERSIQLAETHLGTQGDGNHFLYVGQLESTGETVVVTHHGSRGFGANLYKKGMQIAESYRKLISPKTNKTNAWIPYDQEDGQLYWEALQVVRAWTKENHRVLHQTIAKKGTHVIKDQFWNEHNFVFKDGANFYHAKGATPLDDRFVPDSSDGLRLIPLNMSEPILIAKGATTASNLGFAPHGAGRNISRSKHIRRREGLSIKEIFANETKGIDARFYSGNIDISELPSAYKNADTVQSQMESFGLGDIVDKVIPYGCIMAGDWQKDAPWRKRRKR